MLQILKHSFARALSSLETEFLGPQREFLTALWPDRFRKSCLLLRAPVAPPSPAVRARAEARLAAVLGRDLGVEIEVHIAADRTRDPGSIEPLIDRANRTAHLMFDALAAGRGAGMNPAFVYGPPGSGKTHLLRAFLRRVDVPVTHWTATELHATVARLLRGPGLSGWRKAMLESRLFVLDEVHRLAGKRRTQRELASLMDQLVARSVQMVFLGRHHPRKIHNVGQGLTSRFLGGFTVELGAPLAETRVRFLDALGVDEELRRELARTVVTRARTLGDIVRQVARIRECGLDGAGSGDHDGFLALLVDRVASRFGISSGDIAGTDKSRRVSMPRQVVVFVARKAGIPGAELARRFGWRSASSATYAVRRVEQRMRDDPDFRRTVQSFL